MREVGYPYHNCNEFQLYVAVRNQNVRSPTNKLTNYPKRCHTNNLQNIEWIGGKYMEWILN